MNEKLAIKGGEPVRAKVIRYGHQLIEKDDVDSVCSVLTDDFLTCGPKVEEAEKKLAEYAEAKYAVLVSSGTAALHCACLAAGIQSGDEVITTPLTFAASANSILYCGGKPVFADVDPDTYNICPQSIGKCITDKTKAVIAVDFTGQAVEIDAIKDICNKYGLIFIEDAAHSIGTEYKCKKVGSLADMTCFSFHPVKTVTAGEGGAVLTNDDEFYKKVKLLHTHGMEHDAKSLEAIGSWYYEQIMLGYNYRMTDFQAALLLSQLDKIDRFKKRRIEIVNRYNAAFKDTPGIILQKEISQSHSCRHLYIIRIDSKILSCTRREFFEAMAAENVLPQIHYIPVYWFPYYKKLGYSKGLCPNAENIYENIMSIPLFPGMSDRDIDDVIHAVRKVANFFRK